MEALFFRISFTLGFVALFAIRIYYQLKTRRGRGPAIRWERGARLILGSLSAGLMLAVLLVFGISHILFPTAFGWAYRNYPSWLRWIGVLCFAGGDLLLARAHHYLDRNFSAFIRIQEGQTLVQNGPYRWIRHPIYLAYFLAQIGGGLVSAHWVLTVFPALFLSILVALRVREEERALTAAFGAAYQEYARRTGQFLPRRLSG